MNIKTTKKLNNGMKIPYLGSCGQCCLAGGARQEI